MVTKSIALDSVRTFLSRYLTTYSTSLYVLPIQGADVVLGVQWLQTLGPFVSDFTIPSMKFYHNDSLLTITGSKTLPLTPATFHQFTRMLHTDAIDHVHAITMSLTAIDTEPIPITFLHSFP